MKAILIAGVVALSISLVGCGGGSSSPTPAPTVTVTATPEPPKVDLAPAEPATPTNVEPAPKSTELSKDVLDMIFLRVIRKEYPQYNDSDKDLLALGAAACQKLDEGIPANRVLGAIDPNASNSGYLYFIIGAAVGTYCPEYSSDFKAR